jgi:hypothetical protein
LLGEFLEMAFQGRWRPLAPSPRPPTP